MQNRLLAWHDQPLCRVQAHGAETQANNRNDDMAALLKHCLYAGTMFQGNVYHSISSSEPPYEVDTILFPF